MADPSNIRRWSSLLFAALLTLATVLATGATAFAADGEDTVLNLGDAADQPVADTPGSSGGSLVRTIVGLAVVIAVIYGLTWVLRQVKSSKTASAAGTGLEPVATLPLGANRSLHLVRTGEEVVLVGVAEHGVTPIRTYTVGEARALGLLPDDVSVSGGGLATADGAPGPFDAEESKLRRGLDALRKRTVIRR